MIDEITEAVLAREEVARYLEGSHGDERRGARASDRRISTSCSTTQRYELYRALEYPLYPILRKIERIGENISSSRSTRSRSGRVVYASNHRSHIDYLVEPLVLDDAGIRPPIIAAGINLFGGPLGLIHKHVTGAMPIRRNTKDPAYLITLKAYVGELLRKHDLFFYPEGGRSYSGELKPPKTGLISAALQARHRRTWCRADRGRLRPGARGSRPRAQRSSGSSGRSAASSPRWCATPSATAAARSSPSASRSRSTASIPTRGERCWIWRTRAWRRSAGCTKCCRRRCSPRRCGRRSTRRELERPHRRVLDTLRAVGANLGVTSAARRGRAAAEPLEARGIIVVEEGRFRVRERNVLRYYARSLEHLLSPAGPTH